MLFASEADLIQIGATASVQENRLSASEVLRTVDDVGNTWAAGNRPEMNPESLNRLFISANAFVESVIGSTHQSSNLFSKTGVLCS